MAQDREGIKVRVSGMRCQGEEGQRRGREMRGRNEGIFGAE